MKFNRLAGVIALCTLTTAAAAAYPDKPIRVIVPWPAGGLVDIPARLIGAHMEKSLGQPVIVENRPGAGGVVGAEAAAKAPADGYTIMLTTSALNMNDAMRPEQPFEAGERFDAVAPAAYASLIVVAHPEKGPRSLQALLERAKAEPGKLNYASAGNGTPGHFSGELLKSMADVDIVHVAYKGGPPAMVDQIAGLVDFHFANAAVAIPQIKAGKVIPLAVASDKRLALLPDVPTMAEAGVPDFNSDQWIGYLAPAGTPPATIERLNTAINQALQEQSVQDELARNGMMAAAPATPAEFEQELKQDFDKWAELARTADIRQE